MCYRKAKTKRTDKSTNTPNVKRICFHFTVDEGEEESEVERTGLKWKEET